MDAISLFALSDEVDAAVRRGDDHWLVEVVTTLIDFKLQLWTAERKAREYAEGLSNQAKLLRKMQADAKRGCPGRRGTSVTAVRV